MYEIRVRTSVSRIRPIEKAPCLSVITVTVSKSEATVTVAPISGTRCAESTTTPCSDPVLVWASAVPADRDNKKAKVKRM